MPSPFPILPVITTTIVASPAAAVETIIASLPGISVGDPNSSVRLMGWAVCTVGAAGTAVGLRIRRTSVTGTAVINTGGITQGVVAGGTDEITVLGLDTPGEQASLVYVLTMTVTAANAVTTVLAVQFEAQVFG